MNSIKFYFVFLFLVPVILTGCATSDRETPTASTDFESIAAEGKRIELNLPIPEFAESTMSGEILTSESFKGRVTLVNFWATWCGPCVIEIPDLVALRDEWSDQPFEIVGISMDLEGFEIVEPFATDFQINYPIILDEGDLADAFGGVYALPTTFLVDENGTIVYRFIGLFPFEEMRGYMNELLEKAEAS
ncbi:MAG: redoxin domain-containing protein [Rhodothermia bacterium]|nr:MAG: redoxin domain-containing protein [Rhodothermia bacterium]